MPIGAAIHAVRTFMFRRVFTVSGRMPSSSAVSATLIPSMVRMTPVVLVELAPLPAAPTSSNLDLAIEPRLGGLSYWPSYFTVYSRTTKADPDGARAG